MTMTSGTLTLLNTIRAPLCPQPFFSRLTKHKRLPFAFLDTY
jgi:hypothetical protein